jgi:hypothetical protein
VLYKRKISESSCSCSLIHYNQLVTICTENFICDEFTFTARILRYSRMQLLSGGNYDIDIDDFKSNTRYTGGYCEGSRTIKIFWEVLEPYWWLLHTCTHIAIPFPIHHLCIPNYLNCCNIVCASLVICKPLRPQFCCHMTHI